MRKKGKMSEGASDTTKLGMRVEKEAATVQPERKRPSPLVCFVVLVVLVGIIVVSAGLGWLGSVLVRNLAESGAFSTATLSSYWEVPTARPTETATRVPAPSPRPTRTPSGPSCRQWSEVSISDVGSTMCVQGIIQSAWWDSSQRAFFVTFSTTAGSYYIVLYGWRFTDLIPGDCVRSTGEIGHLGDSPVMTIDAYDLIICNP